MLELLKELQMLMAKHDAGIWIDEENPKNMILHFRDKRGKIWNHPMGHCICNPHVGAKIKELKELTD